MTPAARVQAAIELLDEIAATDAPADLTAGRYTRARRYMGAKDRRAVVDRVYAILRSRARLAWWCARAVGTPGEESGRRLAIAALAMEQGAEPVGALFDGAPYHPAPLEESEAALAEALTGQVLDHPAQGPAARLELPDWLLPRLRDAFGPDLEIEMAALNLEAPLDLRVNTLKADLDTLRAALLAEGIAAAPIPHAPLGLRVERRRAVKNTRVFRDGQLEIQDAGSQIAALLVDARPAMAVADFCAGAGGKTLALAAAMANRGKLIALDVDRARLDRAAARLRRAGASAGASLVERHVLRDDWLAANAGRFDRVLVDAPCSGSGVWRRDPRARWQLTAERLAHYREAQADSLRRAAALARPGGRLVYVTCSLLPEENEVRIETFLKEHAGFALRPAARVWDETLGPMGVAPPVPAPFRNGCLLLTPARHGTDGFFVAILEHAGLEHAGLEHGGTL